MNKTKQTDGKENKRRQKKQIRMQRFTYSYTQESDKNNTTVEAVLYRKMTGRIKRDKAQ